MKFHLEPPAENYIAIQPRKREAEENSIPFVFRGSPEAKKFTTYPLPELTPNNVKGHWSLHTSITISYSEQRSWDKAVHSLQTHAGTGKGFTLETISDAEAILHIYHPPHGE